MKRSWRCSFLMYLWLTIGFAIFHHVVVLWGITLFRFLVSDPNSYESLLITKSGEPIVQLHDNRNREISFRQIDGTPIVDTLGIQKNFAGGNSLAPAEPGEPMSWNVRLDSFHDFQKPATSWYLVAEPNRNHTAYFVGYEPRSRQLVGYLGTDGFSLTRPPESSSFPVQPSPFGAFQNSLVASQKAYNYANASEPHGDYLQQNYIPLDNANPDTVWLLSQGTLYQIELGERRLKTMFTNRSEFKNLIRSTINHGDTTSLQLICWSESELLLIDPKSEQTKTLPHLPVPAGTWETLHQLPDNRVVLVYVPQTGILNHPENYRVIWMNSDGAIERELETKLHGYRSGDENLEVFAGLICPAPFVALNAWVIAPFFMSKDAPEAQTYFSRFSNFGRTFSSWIAVSIVVGLAAGWACRRRERDVFHNSNWFWPILVGISGWFGWVGYAILRPLPARLPDGSWLPKQPEPAQALGTEIFA